MRNVRTVSLCLEEAYRAYFADPAARARERRITEDFLRIATWPGEEE